MKSVLSIGTRAFLCSCVLALSLKAAELDPTLKPQVTNGRIFGDFWSYSFFQPLRSNPAQLAQWVRNDYLPAGYVPRVATINNRFARRIAVGAALNGDIFIRSDELFSLFRIPANDSSPAEVVTNSDHPLVLIQPDGKVLLLESPPRRVKADGTVDSSFSVTAPDAVFFSDQYLQAAGLQTDGKILIGGKLDPLRNVPSLVRFNSDGSRDTSFTPTAMETVLAVLPLRDGRILTVAGNLTSQAANRLIVLRADGSLEREVSLTPNGAIVYDLAQTSDGQVILAGTFELGVPARRNLVRFNPDNGTFDSSFNADAYTTSSNGSPYGVSRIDLQPDDKILYFLEGTRIARLNADGSLDASYASGTPLAPRTFALSRDSNGRMVIGGGFVTVDGAARPGLARLAADGTLDATFIPNDDVVIVVEHLAAQTNGTVIAAGEFRLPSAASARRLARFTASGELDPTFDVELDANGRINVLVPLADGRVVAAGRFSTVNGELRSHLMAFRADGSLDTDFARGISFDQQVRIVRVRPTGGFFVGGDFTTVDGIPRPGIAALNADGTLDSSFVPNLPANLEITAVAPLASGGVAVGFSKSASYDSNVVRLTGTGARDPSFRFPIESRVTIDQLAEDSRGRLIAAYSTFEHAGDGVWSGFFHVQRFLSDGSLDTSLKLGAGTSKPVTTLILESDDSLLLAGTFDRFDDLPTGPVARVRLDRHTALPSLLFNVSTRGHTAPGDNVLIAGFVIGGTTPKTVLLRGVGPTLSGMSVSGALTNPMMNVHNTEGVVGTNIGWLGWRTGKFSYADPSRDVLIFGRQTGAFPLQFPEDAAFVMRLNPGPYTVHVAQKNKYSPYVNEPLPPTDHGIALLEVYDVNALPGDRRLMNISSRGRVGTGEQQLIAGFVVSGSAPRRVLVRAVGPTLATMDVPTPLANPMLTLMQGPQVIASNDDWDGSTALTTAFDVTGAFDLPTGSKDAALILTLDPGPYTVHVSSRDGATGIALVEVYDYP